MATKTSRRRFLRSAPAAAVAGFALGDALTALAQGSTGSGTDIAAAALPFQFFSAGALESEAKSLEGNPGNKNLFDAKSLPLQIVMTCEKAKSATEFEWHEGRDHIVQILDGSTVYEVGGVPTKGHNVRAGEWLSPTADGAKTVRMAKGDMLVIPRGTLHKRSTADSVVFLLISTPGVVKI